MRPWLGLIGRCEYLRADLQAARTNSYAEHYREASNSFQRLTDGGLLLTVRSRLPLQIVVIAGSAGAT
jgi:hypothetical protein